MKEQIIGILEEISPGIDFETETTLVDDGILDSMDIVALVNTLDSTFDVEIGVIDMNPQNFNSVQAIQALIEKLQ